MLAESWEDYNSNETGAHVRWLLSLANSNDEPINIKCNCGKEFDRTLKFEAHWKKKHLGMVPDESVWQPICKKHDDHWSFGKTYPSDEQKYFGFLRQGMEAFF
jgi:hypothetical protein